ncbi:Uncharacterized protein APZ42_021081 [Daphnia magna]|uniref:Uncharacterized protein n=1 Tax=Daphnia magna TaxID=35525 RepID=A0A164WY74_9CRUS|nr:Uncharacterized protein APZ42_021081 [Daphnia magna]
MITGWTTTNKSSKVPLQSSCTNCSAKFLFGCYQVSVGRQFFVIIASIDCAE